MERLVLQVIAAALVMSLGYRLIRLSRETGGKPERWLGGFFGIAGLSLALSPIGAEIGSSNVMGRVLITMGQGATTIALICLIRFNWQVFRPGSTPARNFAIFCGGLDLATFLMAAWVGFGVALQTDIGHLFVFSRFLILAWACYESSAHALKMRRQMALGIADPVVANRFLLWALWTGILAFIPVIVTGMRLTGALVIAAPGEPVSASVKVLFGILAGGALLAAVAVAFAFFPPARYQAWLRQGANPA